MYSKHQQIYPEPTNRNSGYGVEEDISSPGAQIEKYKVNNYIQSHIGRWTGYIHYKSND